MAPIAPVNRRRVVAAGSVAAVGASLLSAGMLTPQLADAATTVCAGQAHCTVVAHTDLNGDGRTDTVAVKINSSDSLGPTDIEVRAKLAGLSRVRTYAMHHVGGVPADGILRGVAPIDGRKGREIVIADQAGAHTMFYRVIGFHDGRLHIVRPPQVPGSSADSLTRDNWVTDGSVASEMAIARSTKYGVRVTLKEAHVVNGDFTRYAGHRRTYRWNGSGWTHVSTVTKHWDHEPAGYWGWQTKYLQGM